LPETFLDSHRFIYRQVNRRFFPIFRITHGVFSRIPHGKSDFDGFHAAPQTKDAKAKAFASVKPQDMRRRKAWRGF